VTIIDLHTHGIDGVDTRTEDADQILGIAETQGREGVSNILLSVYSGPITVMRKHMEAVRRAMESQETSLRQTLNTEKSERRSINTPPSPQAQILGVHLEGPFLNPQWCGALDGTSFLDPNESAFQELAEGFESIIKTVTIAPERRGSSALTRIMDKMGITVNLGHSGATWAETESCFRVGARGITHLFNAMRPFHHREPGIAGFGLLNPDIYVEVIGDLNHLASPTMDLIFRTKRRDRILLVSDSVAGTMTSNSQSHTQPEMHGRLSGGSKSLTAAIQTLVAGGFDEELIRGAVTANPRTFLGLT
jgi:N-acetylglucosamine-6-phosphate deacetylase